MKKFSFLPLVLLTLTLGCSRYELQLPYFLYAAEPTQGSVILQARVNESDSLVNNDIQGLPAEIKFQLVSDTSTRAQSSPWISTRSENDFYARYQFDRLEPGTPWFYRIIYKLEGKEKGSSKWQHFNTLPDTSSEEEVKFVMVTGMNFWRFSTGVDQYGNRIASSGELKTGFPAYTVIESHNPDFFIGNGDNVYYDQPRQDAATTPEEMRKHWHRLFHMDNFQSMLAEVPVYWLKDDHDHRYNDSDTLLVNQNGVKRLPSNQTGIELFHEQAAFSMLSPDKALPYRTYRLNADLQVWFVEGRDFRSPNHLPDGPGKSIWGEEQKEWLKKGLLESNARFKLLVSPTPLVGPDDNYKSDNHTNPKGFRYERDQFIEWLKSNDILGKGFYSICGDRHWQYHSIAPSGLEEFSCGALVDANSRLGRLPGDPESTDPEGEIIQPYTQEEASGGFLEVELVYESGSPQLVFSFFDDEGTMLYSTVKND